MPRTGRAVQYPKRQDKATAKKKKSLMSCLKLQCGPSPMGLLGIPATSHGDPKILATWGGSHSRCVQTSHKALVQAWPKVRAM